MCEPQPDPGLERAVKGFSCIIGEILIWAEYFKEKEIAKMFFKLVFIPFCYHFSGSYLKTPDLPDI